MIGPNDYHYEGGQLIQGLGADEPTEKARLEMLERTEREREREAKLAAAQAAVEQDAAALDTRQADLEAREAELSRRLRELEEREEELTAPTGAGVSAASGGSRARSR